MSAVPSGFSPSTLDPISEDRPRFAVIIITSQSQIIKLSEIESLQTDKTETGDAGTWSFTAPLGLYSDVAAAIGPMDLVALYADRTSTDRYGITTGNGLDLASIIGSNVAGSSYESASYPSAAPRLTYGAPGAAVTTTLGTAACLMIGMIDGVEETIDYEGARRELSVHGRDLTKVFIDNDTWVPYTVAQGDDVAYTSNLIIHKTSSGTQLLRYILNVFVLKDPNTILEVAARAGAQVPKNLVEIAAYGYPWNNFVRDDLLIAGFQSLANGQFPNYSVQSGSAWTNIVELRNFPICRLFVNELGALIFDDTWTAWGFGSAYNLLATDPAPIWLDDGDVRKVSFRQGDDDVVTALSIASPQMSAGDTQLAGLATMARARVGTNASIGIFGYRYAQFTSQYDALNAAVVTPATAANPKGTSTTDPTQSVLDARFPILWQLHNDIWYATFTLRGNAKWRVGQRLSTDISGAAAATQPLNGTRKLWYITQVQHSLQWGSDWVTTLTARFPQDAAGRRQATTVP